MLTRVSVILRPSFARSVSTKPKDGEMLKKKFGSKLNPKLAQDMNSLLRPHREPEMTKLYQMDTDLNEMDINAQERIAAVFESEYRRARSGLNKAAARRSMEHGPQEPNLLTAAQKTELRRLATEDPQQWPPTRLASSFGISADAVRRLLKSRWQPTSPKEIERHDRKVAARRRALGLPAPPVPSTPAPATAPAALEAPRPRGPMTALLHICTPPPPSVVPATAGAQTPAISAIYSRDDVLQFPVSDARDDPDGGMRILDVPVKISRKHMTFDELKRQEKSMEQRKRLQVVLVPTHAASVPAHCSRPQEQPIVSGGSERDAASTEEGNKTQLQRDREERAANEQLRTADLNV